MVFFILDKCFQLGRRLLLRTCSVNECHTSLYFLFVEPRIVLSSQVIKNSLYIVFRVCSHWYSTICSIVYRQVTTRDKIIREMPDS